MQKMERILIGDKTYPIRIDLNVLEAIQEEYGSVHKFELELIGLKKQPGEEGEDRYIQVEPSIKAIRMVLPLMVNEGLAIEAAAAGRAYEPAGELQIIAECNISYEELSKIIHEEFKRCFKKK